MSLFCIACSNTNKNIYKKIAVPTLEQFKDCKEDGKVRNNFRFYKCNEKDPNIEFPLISKNEVHIAFTHTKAVNDILDITLYRTAQMYLDCKNKEISYRTVDLKETKNGETIDKEITETDEQRTNYKIKNDKNAIDVVKRNCPVREGYERIGVTQLDFKNALRRGNYRNISTFDGWDFDYTTTIDCKKILIGINDEADQPIKPKSVGYKIFKKVC